MEMEMTDLTSAIEPKSDQLNSDDLVSGPRTIKITKVVVKDSGEQRVSIFFEGDNNKPAKTMTRLLVAIWKNKDSQSFVGKSVTLYRDPSVTWGALAVGGIRVSHASHIDEKMVIAVRQKKGVSTPVTILPLKEDTQQQRPSASQPTTDPYADYARTFARKLKEEPWQAVDSWWQNTAAEREGMAQERIGNMEAALAAKIEKETANG
jgi:hypothetical protein